MSTTLKINSFDQSPLHVYHWPSQSITPSKVVLIIHGMMEHGRRYTEFGQYLSEHNIAVYAYDQRGHGQTAPNPNSLGILNGNWETLVKDAQHVIRTISAKYSGIPVVILGHSMGSYVAQHLAALYGNHLAGLILSGTSKETPLDVFFGSLVASFFTNNIGANKKANLIHNIIFSKFNNQFTPTQSPSDWLSRDNAIVDEYINDPFCGQICSNNFFKALFDGLKQLNSDQIIPNIPSDLRILMVNGDQDPLSKNGKSINTLIETYQKSGHFNITHKAYPNARHEILNEINRQKVYEDIIKWLS